MFVSVCVCVCVCVYVHCMRVCVCARMLVSVYVLALKWHTLSLRGLQSSTMATRLLENKRSMIHTSPPSDIVEG